MDAPLIPIPEAAQRLGMDVKRLRGLVWKGVLGDLAAPIGGLETDQIYEWEVERMLKKQRATGSARDAL